VAGAGVSGMSAPARPRERLEGKVGPWHRDRLAAVYVRQSTVQQVHDHQESTRLQYGLAERAVALGWAPSRVLVIDEDLGHSASGVDARPGLQRLVSEVGLDHVGIVLGVEMSRLARSGREWHQLLELCALSGTLLADPDGIYGPASHNDRLLLGLKGTISEAGLYLIKQRMWSGRLAKARRGQLAVPLPAGSTVPAPPTARHSGPPACSPLRWPRRSPCRWSSSPLTHLPQTSCFDRSATRRRFKFTSGHPASF
jgi:DNA invertase Pin-like site-specific DNA recombinase